MTYNSKMPRSGEGDLKNGDSVKDWWIWLFSLLRGENQKALAGSLKRRLFQRPFLEMQIENIQLESVDFNADRFQIKDINACVRLLNRTGSLGFWTLKRFNLEIIKGVENPFTDIFLVKNKNQDVIAFMVLHVTLGKNRNFPEVGYVAVDPGERRKKIGIKLLHSVLQESKKRGLTRLELKTDSFRIAAIKIYQKAGFLPIIRNEVDKMRWTATGLFDFGKK